MLYGELKGQVLRFGVVGGANTLIDFGVFNLLVLLSGHPVGMGLMGCNTAAFICAGVNSYFANRNWTFAGRNAVSLTEFGAFFGISSVGLLINSAVLWILAGGLPASLLGINLAKGGATGLSMIWNFCGYRLLLTRQVAV